MVANRYAFTAELDFEVIAQNEQEACKIADNKLSAVPNKMVTSVLWTEVGPVKEDNAER